MNNPFFVLTFDDEMNEVAGIIHNEPLQPPPGEEPDYDTYLASRIVAAVKSKFDWKVKRVILPTDWKDWHKPIPVSIEYMDMKELCQAKFTLTIAWDY